MKRFLTFIFALAMSTSAFSQLSGTYTVGGTAPDYATVVDAITALNTNGISATTVFEIRTGEYDGQLNISTITGVSATDTVVFTSETGNADDVKIYFGATDDAVDNWVVKLDNVSFLSFTNLTIQAEGGNEDIGIVIKGLGNCNNINLYNNHLVGKGSSASPYDAKPIIKTYDDSDIDENWIVKGNTFENCKYFLRLKDAINWDIFDNYFFNPDGYITSLSLRVCENLRIYKNTVDAQINFSYGSGNHEIFNNIISERIDLYSMNIAEDPAINTNVYNNSVGYITVRNADYINLVHNTATRYIKVDASSGNVVIQNNIIQSSNADAALQIEDIASIAQLDYNNVYGPDNLYRLGETGSEVNYTTLADWQAATGFSANSFNQEIFFDEAPQVCINQAPLTGTNLGITEDYEGDARTLPVIGADEYTQVAFSPAVSETEITEGTAIELSSNDMTQGVVTWYDGSNAVIGTGLSIDYTPSESETLTAEWTNGNCSESVEFDITVSATTATNELSENVKLYPNPVSDILNIENVKDANLSLSDLSGRVISEYTKVSGNLSLNLSSLSSGIYILDIESSNNHTTHKIIKK